jgi:hypothetical protein
MTTLSIKVVIGWPRRARKDLSNCSRAVKPSLIGPMNRPPGCKRKTETFMTAQTYTVFAIRRSRNLGDFPFPLVSGLFAQEVNSPVDTG